MLASALLDTPLIVLPGMCEEEIDALWLQTWRRSKATQAFLDREIDVETYLDCMAENGIEPAELLDAAEENLDFVIYQGIPVEL